MGEPKFIKLSNTEIQKGIRHVKLGGIDEVTQLAKELSVPVIFISEYPHYIIHWFIYEGILFYKAKKVERIEQN